MAAEAPPQPRANHHAQIKLAGPAGIRVNTWSGNLYVPVGLGAISGRGPRIALVLSYNSGAHAVATSYGYGWQLANDVYYSRETNGDISVVWGTAALTTSCCATAPSCRRSAASTPPREPGGRLPPAWPPHWIRLSRGCSCAHSLSSRRCSECGP